MDFNSEASRWDNNSRVKRAEIIAEEISKAIRKRKPDGISKGKPFDALEFGCGTGLVSFNLKDRFEHITLIDTSEGMIDELNRKIKDQNIANMTARHTDITTDTTLQDGLFDVVFTSMALHHVEDIKAVLAHFYRLLRKDGLICIVDLTEDDGSFHKGEQDFRGHHGFNQNDLEQLLQELSFKNTSSHVFFSDTKTIEGKKIAYSLFLMTGEK